LLTVLEADVAAENVSRDARLNEPSPPLSSIPDWSRALFEDEGRTDFIQATGAAIGVLNMFMPVGEKVTALGRG
jgi:hypothetical protein